MAEADGAERVLDVLLEARDVSRRFGRRWAVRRVDVAFPAGTVTTLLGHNGAGKSTLLGLLSGQLRPNEGQVLAFGADLHDPPDRAALRQQLGILGHLPFVYPELTGVENLRFMASLYGRPADEPRLTELLDFVGLRASAHRPARTYSRGMVQRLALARLMAQDARIWLLDEPTTGLDVQGRALLVDVLARGKAEGRAIALVTHDPESVARVTDRVLVLDAGRLRAQEAAA